MPPKTRSKQPIKIIVSSKSRETSLACRICSMSFKRKKDLKDHIRFHPAAKPFACKICGKRFVKDEHLKCHLLFLHGPKIFICEEGCEKSFVRESDMKAHTILHEKKKPYSCKKCGKRFKTKRFYKTHYNVHRTGATFVPASEVSGYQSKETPDSESDEHINQQKIRNRTRAALVPASHENRDKEMTSDSETEDDESGEHTNQQKIRVFTCNVCNKHFKRNFNLKRHLASHASKFFTCVECGPEVKLKDIASRQKHYTICHFGKPFKCFICSRFFSTKKNKERHLLTHLDTKSV